MTDDGIRFVAEERLPGELPVWIHPEWRERFPWLVQGVTSSGAERPPFDLGLFGEQPVGEALGRWLRLREAMGVSAATHARQVHGASIRLHEAHPGAALLLLEGYDAHVTRLPDLLLTVSIADCVPVSIVDPRRRGIALVHAGWRGAAAGIVEGAVSLLTAAIGSEPGDLRLHCGPAICGRCYEVGPEVHAAVHPDRRPPEGPEPIDLRAALVRRAAELGLAPGHLSVSTHCTRCGDGDFFSHRGGARARQVAFLAIRPAE